MWSVRGDLVLPLGCSPGVEPEPVRGTEPRHVRDPKRQPLRGSQLPIPGLTHPFGQSLEYPDRVT